MVTSSAYVFYFLSAAMSDATRRKTLAAIPFTPLVVPSRGSCVVASSPCTATCSTVSTIRATIQNRNRFIFSLPHLGAMSSYAHLGLLVLLVIIPASTGYGGGAPTSACVNMTPNHTDAVVQQSASPFSLKVTGDLTTATDTLKVCVTGKTFKGILLQMRVVGHTLPIGTFNGTKRTLANDTKLMNCSAVGDTVTHSKPSSKSSGTCFIWISPDSDIPDNVHFVATIVENLTLYWVNVTSDVINPPLVISTSGPQDITTATSDAITTNTTSMRDDIPTTTSRDSGAIAPGVAFTTCAVCSLLAIVVRLLH